MSGEAPLRVAVAGTGLVFPLYERAMAVRRDVALVAIVHPRGTACSTAVPVFPDLDALFASPVAVDAVVVLSPAQFHAAQAVTAMRAGKHVLVEKPVGLDLAEIDTLIAARGRGQTACLPAHTYLYDPGVWAAEEAMASGSLGAVRFAQARYLKVHPEAMSARYPRILHQHGMHLIYLLSRLLGRPLQVQAHLGRVRYSDPEVDDLALLTLAFPSGAIGQVTLSIGVGDLSVPGGRYEFQLLGEHGSLQHGWTEGIVHAGDDPPLNLAYVQSFGHLLDAFVEACRGNGVGRSGLADARDAECVRLAALASASRGCWIDVDYKDGHPDGVGDAEGGNPT